MSDEKETAAESLERYARENRLIPGGIDMEAFLTIDEWPRHSFRNWRSFVPDPVRESWPGLSMDARLIAFLWAEERRVSESAKLG